MTRGRLGLWADSAFEAQVITSFLEAADYQVVNLIAPGYIPDQPAELDVGIVVLDRWDSNLTEVSAEVRELAGNWNLPLVIIATDDPFPPDPQRHVLLRPVRLFELVRMIEQVIKTLNEYQTSQKWT